MRQGEIGGMREAETVVSPGDRASVFAAKVKSLVAYNVYNISAVEPGAAGTQPAEYGDQMQAVNLAEDFLSQGALAEGTFVLAGRVGDKNVFYAPA